MKNMETEESGRIKYTHKWLYSVCVYNHCLYFMSGRNHSYLKRNMQKTALQSKLANYVKL
jgi:hypothetical protein